MTANNHEHSPSIKAHDQSTFYLTHRISSELQNRNKHRSRYPSITDNKIPTDQNSRYSIEKS